MFFMQGWTQNSRMKPLPVKAIEGPDTVRALHLYDSLNLQMCTCLYWWTESFVLQVMNIHVHVCQTIHIWTNRVEYVWSEEVVLMLVLKQRSLTRFWELFFFLIDSMQWYGLVKYRMVYFFTFSCYINHCSVINPCGIVYHFVT